MSFTRQTEIALNFDENTFYKSEPYKRFIDQNPNLKYIFDYLIINFIEWARYSSEKKDLCISINRIVHDKSWSVNENKETLEEFKAQMGTTNRKFSLTESSNLPNKTVQLFAEVFSHIGFTVYVVEFTPWRLGYDYKIDRF